MKTVVIFKNGIEKRFNEAFFENLKKRIDEELDKKGKVSSRQWFIDGMFNLDDISACYKIEEDED